MQGTWSDPQLMYQGAVSRVASFPEDGEAWFRLGCVLQDRKRWNAACGCLARALELLPDDPRVLTHYGWNLHLAGRSEEAGPILWRATAIAPDLALGWVNRGIVAGALGEEGAVEFSRKGMALEPGNGVYHMALAFALMFEGQWKEGLLEYEHRFEYKIPEFLTRPFPLWRGEEVTHLYIEGEQGLGDLMMMLRYVRGAAKRAERVTFYCHGPAYSLLMERFEVPGNVDVKPLPRALPAEADAWCPLFSLPVALEAEGPERELAYIKHSRFMGSVKGVPFFADPPIKSVLNIGIVWAGAPEHEEAHNRDCPLVYFLPLAEIPNVRLHALQIGQSQSQIGHMAAYGLVNDRSPEITNLNDTARIIEELDLVITVDTGVAHLSGAMGVPTWLLINTMGQDFRWGRSGDETPWYPSLRIFRRSLDEQWSDVMGRVAEALKC